MRFPSAETSTLIERVFAALPAAEIGAVYCDEGGAEFFADRAPEIVRTGRAWSVAAARRLAEVSAGSLYVGAGLAELPVLLTEAVDLGREVVVANLRGRECELLNAALRAADVDPDRLQFVAADAGSVVDGRRFGHVSMVSVLTDPETYPVVSDVSYGRVEPVRLDLAAFEQERATIRALVATCLDALERPGLVTTTADEVSWFLDWAARADAVVEADDEVIESVVVGDPIGFLRVRDAESVQ